MADLGTFLAKLPVQDHLAADTNTQRHSPDGRKSRPDWFGPPHSTGASEQFSKRARSASKAGTFVKTHHNVRGEQLLDSSALGVKARCF